MTRVHHAAAWAPLPLRLAIGYGFLAHGLAKLEKGPERFVAIVDAIGAPLPHFTAWLTIWVEIAGGLCVLAGALVPLAAVPMAAVLVTAMLTVHLRYGFTSIKLIEVTAAGPKFGPPGIETDLLYLAGLATLVLGGSGRFAVDNVIVRAIRRRSKG